MPAGVRDQVGEPLALEGFDAASRPALALLHAAVNARRAGHVPQAAPIAPDHGVSSSSRKSSTPAAASLDAGAYSPITSASGSARARLLCRPISSSSGRAATAVTASSRNTAL